MLEGSVMEYVKWIVIVISIAFVAIVTVGMFKLNEVNSFQQEVNYQVERHGGLTDDAYVALNKFVSDNYGSCVVKGIDGTAPEDCKDPFYLAEFDDEDNVWIDERGNDQAPFGTQIHYGLKRSVGQIQGMPLFEPTVIGTSASRVRGTIH